MRTSNIGPVPSTQVHASPSANPEPAISPPAAQVTSPASAGATGEGGQAGSSTRTASRAESSARQVMRRFVARRGMGGGDAEAIEAGKRTRENVEVKSVARGIVHVKLNGDARFFERVGMSGVETPKGPKRLEYMAASLDRYTPHLAGGSKVYLPTSPLDAPSLRNVLSAKRSLTDRLLGSGKAGTIAYINGGFYNASFLATPAGVAPGTYPVHASIGDVRIRGVRTTESISPPKEYAQDYATMRFPNGSFLTSGPVLARENSVTKRYESTFTAEKASLPRYQYDKNAFKPGVLSHAGDPNPRSGIAMPKDSKEPVNGDLRTAKTHAARIAIGMDHSGLRGKESNGFKMHEWSSVMTRIGSFNKHPGMALNLDGGASSVMGVVASNGKKLAETTGASGSTPTATTFIALQEATPSTARRFAARFGIGREERATSPSVT